MDTNSINRAGDNREDDSVSISSCESFEVLDEPLDSLRLPPCDERVDANSIQSSASTASSSVFMSEITQRVHDLVEENKCFKGLLQQNNLIFNEHLANLAKWQEDIESCQQKMKKQYEEADDIKKLLQQENEQLKLKLKQSLPNETEDTFNKMTTEQKMIRSDSNTQGQQKCEDIIAEQSNMDNERIQQENSQEDMTNKFGELATEDIQTQLVAERRMRKNLVEILETITKTDNTEENILALKPLLAELGIMLNFVEPMMSKYFNISEEMMKVIEAVKENNNSDSLLTQVEYLSMMLQTEVNKKTFHDVIALVHRLDSILMVYEDHVKAQKEVHQHQLSSNDEKMQSLCSEKADMEKQIVNLYSQLSTQRSEFTEKLALLEKEKLSLQAEVESLKNSQSSIIPVVEQPRQMYRCPVCLEFFPTEEGIQGHIDDCLASSY